MACAIRRILSTCGERRGAHTAPLVRTTFAPYKPEPFPATPPREHPKGDLCGIPSIQSTGERCNEQWLSSAACEGLRNSSTFFPTVVDLLLAHDLAELKKAGSTERQRDVEVSPNKKAGPESGAAH